MNHMVKLFLQVCVEKALVALSSTPENIIFSSKFMSHLIEHNGNHKVSSDNK